MEARQHGKLDYNVTGLSRDNAPIIVLNFRLGYDFFNWKPVNVWLPSPVNVWLFMKFIPIFFVINLIHFNQPLVKLHLRCNARYKGMNPGRFVSYTYRPRQVSTSANICGIKNGPVWFNVCLRTIFLETRFYEIAPLISFD